MVLIDVSDVAPTLDGMKLTYKKHTFIFKIPGGTSRGILQTKNSWILSLHDDCSDFIATAECSIIEGLSPEFTEEDKYVQQLDKFGLLDGVIIGKAIYDKSISLSELRKFV